MTRGQAGARRAGVALLVAAAAAFVAFAGAPAGEAAAQEAQQAPDAASVDAEIRQAFADGGGDAVVAILQGLLADGAPRDRTRHVQAAKTAWDVLPHETAGPYAARLLAEALRIDSTNRDGAWDAAQRVRRDLFRRVDVENGVPLLRKLVEIYPSVPEYRSDLARLLLDGGRRAEAREVLEVLTRMAPADPWSAYQLAILDEEEGRLEAAVAQYDRLVRTRPQELRAYLYKARALARTDPGGAREALRDLERAATALPSESSRADFLEQAQKERRALDRAEADRETILAMLSRIRWTAWAALAGWAVVVWLLALWTRPAPRSDAGPAAAG